jgi:hypothetical protein
MIGLHRKEKVVVSVNRVGMACGEAGKRTGLNGKNSSAKTRFFIYHGGAWWMELWGWWFVLKQALVFLRKYSPYLNLNQSSSQRESFCINA